MIGVLFLIFPAASSGKFEALPIQVLWTKRVYVCVIDFKDTFYELSFNFHLLLHLQRI